MTLQPGLDGMVIPKLLGKWTLGQFDLRSSFRNVAKPTGKAPGGGMALTGHACLKCGRNVDF